MRGVARILASPAGLFLLTYETEGPIDQEYSFSFDLVPFDLESGTPGEAICEEVVDVAPAGNGGVVILRHNADGHEMEVLRWTHSAGLELVMAELGDAYSFIAMDNSQSALYLATFNRADRIDISTRERHSILGSAGTIQLEGFLLRAGRIYAYDAISKKLLIMDPEVEREQPTLSLVNIDGNADPRIVYARQQVSKGYPQMAFEFSDIPTQRLNLALMSGEGDLDILCMHMDDYGVLS